MRSNTSFLIKSYHTNLSFVVPSFMLYQETMQEHMSGLLSLFLLVLPALLCLGNSGIKISRVVPVSQVKDWMAALSYCRKNYSDLATLHNDLDYSKVEMYDGWIGLYLTQGFKWKWSADSDEVENIQMCTFKNQSNLETEKCEHQHPFLCMDKDLILFPEAKTWEEALQYCRELNAVEQTQENTRLIYDLASMPGISILMNTEESGVNTTDEVWVGLRFLADKWTWLSGKVVNNSRFPHCPGQDQRCGALSQNSSEWKIIDCSERRSFICSINTKCCGSD